MLRLLGAGCLVAAAGLLGERKAQAAQQAMAIVDALLVSFTVLEAEIGYLAADLRDAFIKSAAAAPLAAGLYCEVVRQMDLGERVTDAWRTAATVWCKQMPLPKRPQAILTDLAAAWGPWRAQDHIHHLHLAERLLQAEQETMRAKIGDTCRLWRYLGLSGGLVLALLIY